MRERIDNRYWRDWCDVLIQCQRDRQLALRAARHCKPPWRNAPGADGSRHSHPQAAWRLYHHGHAGAGRDSSHGRDDARLVYHAHGQRPRARSRWPWCWLPCLRQPYGWRGYTARWKAVKSDDTITLFHSRHIAGLWPVPRRAGGTLPYLLASPSAPSGTHIHGRRNMAERLQDRADYPWRC